MNAPNMFYAIDWNPGYDGLLNGENILVSAGVAWYSTERDRFGDLQLPEEPGTVFVDSGGFQATSRWGLEYPYTETQLLAYAERVDANYVAMPDFACEPALHDSTVEYRVEKTIQAHASFKRVCDAAETDVTPVPVLQGYEPHHYRECAEAFREQGLDTEYMAIGTVCKRTDTDKIHDVLRVCEREFPETDFHLFGLTLNGWKDRRLWGRFRSSDSAAWNWGCSTTEEKRTALRETKRKVSDLQSSIREQSPLTAF